MKQVLVVDDEPSMRAALEANFRRSGWQVRTASGVQEALLQFRQQASDLVVTDMRMADGDGLEVMQRIRDLSPETAVILLTAYGSVPEAVLTMKEGACDYLTKPVPFEQLEETAEQILGSNLEWQDQHAPELIGQSPNFLSLLSRARRVAPSEADILIQAESGTGKELLARLIHRASPRATKPFVAVNCSAFPENLLESELFGHVRGAFTGAIAAKAGKFQVADGGTLLLDEIGEMPLSLQPKLLRVLQEREIDRIGDTHPLRIDVRVVATTNRSLPQLIEAGTFRADLYYRLNVIPLSLPPLRERGRDVVALANYFLRKYEVRGSRRPCHLSPELGEALVGYHWPGNVRELENFIRQAIALSSGSRLGVDLFQPEPQRTATPSIPKLQAAPLQEIRSEPGVTLQDMERSLLEATLKATNGNRTRTAQMMGVSLRKVRNKIRLYGLAARGAQ